jgi:uncharacterized protein (DUF58 family)
MDARLGSAAEPSDIARAARVLWVRSRRQATSWLVGGYASAFRGGGVEFEESRPYAPGDEVRFIDWNALARTDELWVKRHREERSQTVLLLLDVSASMAFGAAGRSKVGTAALAAALLAAAAGRAGDRIGLVAFSDRTVLEVPPGRGDIQTWRVIRAAAEASERCAGVTDLGAALSWVGARTRRRAVVVLLSDYRDEARLGPRAGAPTARDLAELGRRHDWVAGIVEDPREGALVSAGGVRIGDPEHPGRRRLLGTRTGRRAEYRAAAAERRDALARRLRRSGADLLWLSTAGDPLSALGRFFRRRGARPRVAP